MWIFMECDNKMAAARDLCIVFTLKLLNEEPLELEAVNIVLK
jgi:hypothetical protein